MIDIDTEIKNATLNKIPLTLNVLRALKTAISTVLSAKGRNGKPLTQEEELSIIRKQIAQRVESIALWEKAGRAEQAAKETIEKQILETYLPATLEQYEIENLVQRALSETEATVKKDMGKAITRAKELAEGRVDPKVLSQLIAARLS